MKLIGIAAIGTYYSPWFGPMLASIYNVCDEIVVVNHGFDLNDIGKMGPLSRASNAIKHLDIDNKVTEITKVDASKLRHNYPVGTQIAANKRRKNPEGEGKWLDIRGLNITAAQEEAIDLGADWILKIDSDQACYQDIENIREYMDGSLSFYQYEYAGDIGGPTQYLSEPPPATPWMDTVYLYPAERETWYIGAGAIADFHHERVPTYNFHAAHLREANPVWLTEEEKLQHFFGRVAWRLYTNDYGYWCEELFAKAGEISRQMLYYHPMKQTDIRPPEACLYEDPIEYIEKGKKR